MSPARGVKGDMKLLYLGGCHYDSIVDASEETFRGVLPDHRRVVGAAERSRIQLSRDRRAGDVDLALRLSEKDAIEQRQVDEAIRASRMHFDSAIISSDEAEDFDRALRASKEEHDAAESEDAMVKEAMRVSMQDCGEGANHGGYRSDAAIEASARTHAENALLQQARFEEEQRGFGDEDAMLQAAMRFLWRYAMTSPTRMRCCNWR